MNKIILVMFLLGSSVSWAQLPAKILKEVGASGKNVAKLLEKNGLKVGTFQPGRVPLNINPDAVLPPSQFVTPPLKIGVSAPLPKYNNIVSGVQVPKIEISLPTQMEQPSVQASILYNQKVKLDIRENYEKILYGYELPDNFRMMFRFRRIEPYMSTPVKRYGMGEENPEKLYRGMLITPNELEIILEKGFSPADSHWNAGTDGRPAVSFSSSSIEASDYIFHAASKKNAIGVVFEVKNSPRYVLGTDEKLNSTKTIFYAYEEVPAEEIVGVSIYGEYGLESIENILEKIQTQKIRSHTNWTNQFEGFLR